MKINIAHIRARATSGGWIDFAVFDAKHNSCTNLDNGKLLIQLTAKARASGLKVDQSALAFKQGNQVKFYGSKYLVDYLSHSGVPNWTHTINA